MGMWFLGGDENVLESVVMFEQLIVLKIIELHALRVNLMVC